MPFDIVQLMPQISALADYYADHVMPDLAVCVEQAQALLQQTERDGLCQAAQSQAPRVLAFPWEEPSQPYLVARPVTDYRILASDGSDIDPDPHLRVPYALIHVALVALAYNPPDFWVKPHVGLRFRREDLRIAVPGDAEPVPVDRLVVDTLRAYEELAGLWQRVLELPADPFHRPLLAMMDGFILWQHRGEKQEELGHKYLADGVHILTEFHRAGVPIVSFDNTHHYEVVRTLMALECPTPDRMACAGCREAPPRCRILRDLADSDLFGFLPPGARSAIFQPVYRGETGWRLPQAIRSQDPRLGFFYVNTGVEIARIEMPLWIREAGLLDLVHGIVVDQCQPLRAETAGYPVALTLAHNEAALTPRDRQAVQLMVDEALARRGVYLVPSAKARAKGG
jgi:hypothetical protein